MTISLCIGIFVYLSIHPSILSVYLSLHLYIYIYIYFSLSICLVVYPDNDLSTYLYVFSLITYLSICPYIHPSAYYVYPCSDASIFNAPMHLSIDLTSFHASIYQYFCSSSHSSTYLCIYLVIYLPFCLSINLSTYPSIFYLSNSFALSNLFLAGDKMDAQQRARKN